jgi:hypothetical protein
VKVFRFTADLPEGVSYAVKATYLKLLLDSLEPIRTDVKSDIPTSATLEDVSAKVEASVLLIATE